MKSFKGSNFQIARNFINVDNITMNLQCSVCNEIFNNPMRLDCGHTFCHTCLSGWLKKSDQCPNCRIKIIESLINRDLLAYNIIMELDVICNNELKGCPWKGQLSSLVNHMKSCDTSIQILKENQNKNNVNDSVAEELNKDTKEIQQNTFVSTHKSTTRFVSQSVNKFPRIHYAEDENIYSFVKHSREKLIIAPLLKSEEKKMIKEIFLNEKNI